MDRQELIALIEGYCPPGNAASWDRSGIQIHAEHKDILSLAVALDPTPETIGSAIAHGADAVLTHHPLSLSPGLPDKDGPYFRVLKKALAADILLYAAHTTLDTNLNGPAGFLADAFSLQDRAPLETIDGVPPSLPPSKEPLLGYGLSGTLEKPLPREEFLARLNSIFPVQTATLVGTLPKTITRMAYCTGSGASLISAAREAGADVYITGDVKYHAALDEMTGPMAICDVGHHAPEEAMIKVFGDLLAAALPVPVTVLPSTSPFTPLFSTL
ncbi:MAG: Nif3-like dinuclear metal center hexameric protein [Desulfovibrio sp.]|nr:Nif3-like dinuclear metal center hexameric protein [Desulfovibrio sp.]